MAKQSSFDIVSQVDLAEVKNAVNQAAKEVRQRYDLKNSGSELHLDEAERRMVVGSADEFTLRAVTDVLQSKLVRRSVPLKALTFGTIEPAAKGTVRQQIDLQDGIPIEKAREIVKLIKGLKLKKIQASINDDMVRVSGRDRDSLQEVIAALKEADLEIDVQFKNFR